MTMNQTTRVDQAVLQERILEQARAILKCEDIGPQTYFLEVGGDSLVAPILANKIEAEFGVRPQLEDIFTRSFGELAELLRAA
ncbi:MAG: acyl carrier protein [Nitratireductor sp.]|uniref:acyl carrier protein n=2 Tax=Alphaproteobacteria TaxID=28211 RepID=UPI00327DDC20